MSANCTLAREGGSERDHGEERVDSTAKEGRFQEGKGGQARIAFLGEAEGSRATELTQKLSRTICRVLVSLQVWPNLKWDRRLGEKELAPKTKERNESGRLLGSWR